jgi:acylphosphatase
MRFQATPKIAFFGHMRKKQVRIIITGKVQGVFYRASMQQKARALGVTGLVRNQPDGSVYAEAEGTESQLDTLLAWCRQGPPAARVASVQTEEGQWPGREDFVIDRN